MYQLILHSCSTGTSGACRRSTERETPASPSREPRSDSQVNFWNVIFEQCALCRRDYRMLSYIALSLANIGQTSYFLQILDKLQPTLEWMLQQPTTTPLQSSWALGLVFIFWIMFGVIFWPVLWKFSSLSLHLSIRMFLYYVGFCWDNSKYRRLWNLHWCWGWWK